MSEDAKVRCLKVTRPDVSPGQWCVYRLDKAMELQAEFDGAEVGDSIVVELCEMTDQELKDMPDFEGW